MGMGEHCRGSFIGVILFPILYKINFLLGASFMEKEKDMQVKGFGSCLKHLSAREGKRVKLITRGETCRITKPYSLFLFLFSFFCFSSGSVCLSTVCLAS